MRAPYLDMWPQQESEKSDQYMEDHLADLVRRIGARHLFEKSHQEERVAPSRGILAPSYATGLSARVARLETTLFDGLLIRRDEALNLVANTLYRLEGVRSVHYTISNDGIDLWVLIPDRDLTLVEAIADAELNLLDVFDTLHNPTNIDVHILYSMSRSASDLVPKTAKELARPS